MKTKRAFTLIEVLVAVLILGVLAAIAVPRVSQATSSPQVRACKANVNLINSQIELYNQDTGDWPKNLNKIVKDKDYFPEGQPECPFGTTYEYDKDTHRAIPHTEHAHSHSH